MRDWAYTYDALGNISRITENVSGTTTAYTYDNQSQLTGAVISSSDGTTRTEAYVYDTFGNIHSFSNGVTSHSYTYGDSQWRDLLTAVDGTAITYDQSGNPLSYYNGYTMTWEKGRQLASLNTGSKTYTYAYDANGTRIRAACSDGSYVEYHVVDGCLRGESRYKADGTFNYSLRYNYDETGTVCGFVYLYNGATSWTGCYYVKNLQGDVEQVYTYGGKLVAEYEYDSWGNILSMSGSYRNINPFRYRSYYYDRESGFYYLQSRYYDPSIGRFINADAFASTGQGIIGYNIFAYCNNNPVNYTDSTGALPLPIPSLADFYMIHKMVQYDVAEEYGYAIEVYVRGNLGRGYLDLYDAENNQYYEVKSILQAGLPHTVDQMNKYDVSRIKDWRFIGYSFSASPQRGDSRTISGSFEYHYWDITYRSYGNGLILYKYIVNQSRYQMYLNSMLIATCAMATGAVSGLREGRTLGAAYEKFDYD